MPISTDRMNRSDERVRAEIGKLKEAIAESRKGSAELPKDRHQGATNIATMVAQVQLNALRRQRAAAKRDDEKLPE